MLSPSIHFLFVFPQLDVFIFLFYFEVHTLKLYDSKIGVLATADHSNNQTLSSVLGHQNPVETLPTVLVFDAKAVKETVQYQKKNSTKK